MLLALLGSGGCSGSRDTPAAAYRGTVNRIYVATGLAQLFGSPCYRKSRIDGTEAYVFIGYEACYRFDPPRRMVGVWRDEFEGSRFFPGAIAKPADTDDSGIWLDMPAAKLPASMKRSFKGPHDSPFEDYRIEFIGKQTSVAGYYGHMGGSRHYVIVDRVLGATPIP
ncbi:MAG TPA: hypothetical protein VN029_05090 [Sphingomonas sp.]|nr:hypothetical protein [Sphingomonas sp.]